MANLLIDFCEDNQIILESAKEGGQKSLYLTGILAKAEFKNRNNRVYPKSVLAPAVEAYQEKINKRTAFGTLGHDTNSPDLDMSKLSHRITDLSWKGNDCWGKARVLNSGAGQTVASILEAGGNLGFSSRSLGDVKKGKDGSLIVEQGMKILSFDAVLESSTNEYASALYENYQYPWDESLQGTYHRQSLLSEEDMLEQKFALFSDFLKNLALHKKTAVFRRLQSRVDTKKKHIIINPKDGIQDG